MTGSLWAALRLRVRLRFATLQAIIHVKPDELQFLEPGDPGRPAEVEQARYTTAEEWKAFVDMYGGRIPGMGPPGT